MARRLIIKSKAGDKIEMRKPEYDSIPSNSGYMIPVFGPPEFLFEGDFEFEVEELRDYVQVEFVTTLTGRKSSTLYTYVDPGLGLKVGDLVEVPSVFDDHNLAIVKKLGPDNAALAEHIVKTVTARYSKIEAESVDAYDEGAYSAGIACGPEYGCGCSNPEGCY